MKTKRTKLSTHLPLKIKGISRGHLKPSFPIGNELEVFVRPGDEMPLTKIVINGRVFVPLVK